MFIRSTRDFSIGILYAVISAMALFLAKDYPFGTPARIGPGFLPIIVAGLLMAMALLSILRSLRVDGEKQDSVKLMPIILVLGAILGFALLVETAGFLIAGFVLLVLSARASVFFRADTRILLGGIVLVAICALIFIRGLGVAMPLIGF